MKFYLKNKLTKTFKNLLTIIVLLLISLWFSIGCSPHQKDVISKRYHYDAKGQLIRKIAPDGNKTRYEYNKDGLITKIIYPEETVSYGYDASGNRIWMDNEYGRNKYKSEYKYDAFNRLKETVFKYNSGKNVKIKYKYDPWSRISSIEILNRDKIDYQVKYEYNILGNIISIDDGIGRIEYSYYPDRGKIVRHLPNGIKTTFSFSPIGQLTTLEHLDRHNRLIASYTYKYNSPGKISCVIEKTNKSIKVTKYEWDNRGYLTALHLPDGKTIHYQYDSMGNRILEEKPHSTIHYKYDNFGRLIRAENTKYKWNINGNLISETGKEFNARIRYNGRGLPSLIRVANSTFRYQWDGDGNMISKRMGKDTTYYLPNPLAPPGFTLAEYDRTGKTQNVYLYGDTLLGQRNKNGHMQYFLEDGFSSIRYVVDINGDILGHRNYSPFGEPTSMKGEMPVNFRMAGERFLSETRSYLVGSRLYEPKIGRYMTPDHLPVSPLRFDSFNHYTHGSIGTPTNFMEPKCIQTIKEELPIFPKFEPMHIPIGYAPQDYNGPVFKRARELNKLGQRLPLSSQHVISEHNRYWSEGKYWDTNPYYKNLKNLDQVPPLTPENYVKAFRLALGYVVFNFAKGLWGGWEGIVKKVGDTFIPFTPQEKNVWNAAWNIKGFMEGLSNPLKFLMNSLVGELLEGTEQHFGKKYEEFTGCPLGEENFKYLTNDPFKSIENKLGGIKLSSRAEFIGNLSTIAGAVYDPQQQCLVLVGKKNIAMPSIKPEDLAVALACAFDPRYGDPQFSLDPADPRNPRGKWLKAVYMPKEIISGTPFGKSMFEADWLLKQYAFGVSIDKEGRKKKRKSSVPGFKSTVDLTFERPNIEKGKEQWARFWIVSDKMKLREHRNSIYFDVAKMKVKAKKQIPDPSSPTGLRDVEIDDPIATAFADQFSKLYNEISKESPEFARVKELAKAIALAKWIKKERIPIDMGWVTKYVNKRIQTVDRITALSERWEKRTQKPFTQGNRLGIRTIIRQLHLFGGVDLTVKPKFEPDYGQAESLRKEVAAALQRKEAGPVFNITHKGESLRAVVLPITKSGQEMWKSSPTIDKDGISYQFNSKGIITKSTDKFGNIAEYTYDAAQKLKAIKVKAKNGWEAFAEKDDQGSLWTITNPRGNVFQYRYGHSGYLDEIEVDGKRLIKYTYDAKQKVATIEYQRYKEKVYYDSNGYVQEYEVQRVTKAGMVSEPERLFFTRDHLANIIHIKGSSIGHVTIRYSKDKLPTMVKMGQEEIHYVYDSNQRIKELHLPEGLSAIYTYDDRKKLVKIKLKKGDRRAEYIFVGGRIVKACNSSGGKTEYSYNDKGLLNSVIDPEGNKGKYLYDEKNRLREIHFPDGHWIEYNYKDRKCNKNLTHGQSITVISHSSASPIEKISTEKLKGIDYKRAILEERLNDDIKASKNLENGLIIDLFRNSRSMIHANLVYSSGNVKEIAPDIAKKLSWLLNRTAKTRGKLGKTLLEKWKEFYNNYLSTLSKPTYWNSRDGKRVKLKPILIIKSNEVNYKYANLEKVPVLVDNFIIFIASKYREAKDVTETTAQELVTKINNIPRLSKENVVFAIRPPGMTKDKLSEWEETIKELEKVVGKENVLFNPTKEEFSRMLNNRGKEIVVIELTHTNHGIVLKGNERYTSRDVFKGGDLSHIKYLIAGPGTCSLPCLEKGTFAATLRKKGVGIMNTSFGKVSTETALKRLREIIHILKSIERSDFSAYYLPDIIDQLIDISEKGTTNLGKLDYHEGHDHNVSKMG